MLPSRGYNDTESWLQRYESSAVVGINDRGGVAHWPNIGSMHNTYTFTFKDGHFTQLDVDLGDAAPCEPKSFHVEHVLAGVRFAQRRILTENSVRVVKADQKLFGKCVF